MKRKVFSKYAAILNKNNFSAQKKIQNFHANGQTNATWSNTKVFYKNTNIYTAYQKI